MEEDNETKETTQGESKDSVEDKENGVQSKTVETLDRADEIVERRKRENDREENILTRKEALAARQAVGGDTEGGNIKEKPKEETPKEYNDRINKEISEGKHGE